VIHRLRSMPLCWTLLCALPAGVSAQAAAQRPGPVAHTYALLVGSNPGGDGQTELRYAEDDARRMAELLGQLGHFPAAQTTVLLGPDRGRLFAALNDIGQRLAEHRAQAEQAQFVFYYSGHARASAIQLGRQELPLSELRERILALPTTLTLIVLDACQSGAFSNVKGAQPTAAFSYNSVARLRTSGVAVMASSSASELSQESDALRGSYFTHHLMVGLRGAGDRDRDGMVSLAEAYRYAYDRTLSATSRTAVGGQHVTLETELTGQGDVPITYPAQAGAQVELGAALEADVLVEHDGAIFAELHKSAGSELRLALPAGAYNALLRQESALSNCALSLVDTRVTRLIPSQCQPISEADARAKGYLPPLASDERPHESWSLELNIGLGADTALGAYRRRLEDFGFYRDIWADAPWRWQVVVARQLAPHLSVLADVRNLDAAHYERDLLSSKETRRIENFDWSGYALGLQLRAHSDMFRDTLRFYAQFGGGLGLVHSKLGSDAQNYLGPLLSAGAGLFYMPFHVFGFTLQASYSYAPVLSNELGEHHDSGGLTISIGLRGRLWSKP
jgi:hypothetical protein